MLGIDPIDTGRFISTIGFGLTILLTGYQLNQYIKIRILAWIGAVIVMTSYSFSLISTYLMTEALYMPVMLLALNQTWKFLKSEDSPLSSLALSASFTALAIATRYAGVAILFAGIILLLMKRSLGINFKLKYTAIYVSISLTPLIIWMIRNWLSSGTFRQFPSYQDPLIDYLKHFSNLFVSVTLPLDPGVDWFIYLSITVTCLTIWKITQRRKGPKNNRTRFLSTPDNQSYGLSFCLFGLVSLISTVILIFVSPNLGEAYQLPDRHLLSIYMPVIIMALVLLDLLLNRLAGWRTAIELILVCLISTGILGSIVLSFGLNMERNRALATYTQPELFENHGYSKDMELFAYLRNNPVDGKIYTNGGFLLYRFTDLHLEGTIQGVQGIVQEDDALNSCLGWIQELSQEISKQSSYIVYMSTEYLDLTDHPTDLERSLKYCNISEVESNPNIQGYLERIVETSEGTVYRVTRPSGLPGPANFDISMQANTLIYTKEECSPADTELYFFLHVVPVDVSALPEHRINLEFDNLDFSFDDHGIILDGTCIATLELPAYDISKISTGQKSAIGGKLWETELPAR